MNTRLSDGAHLISRPEVKGLSSFLANGSFSAAVSSFLAVAALDDSQTGKLPFLCKCKEPRHEMPS